MKLSKILIISILLLLVSCITEKKRAKICSECPVATEVVTVIDSSWSKTITVHDTVYKTIQGPSVILPGPCDRFCDSTGKLKPFYKQTKKNGVKQTLYTDTKNNTLVQKCDVDSLLQVNEKITTEINKLRIENKKITLEPKIIYKVTAWQSFIIKSGYTAWIVLLTFLAWGIFKAYNKIV